MKKNIKYIFFDVGGVLVLDFSKTNKWDEMLLSLGIKEEDRVVFRSIFKEHEGVLCVGNSSLESVVNDIYSKLHLDIPENHIFLNDFVGRFEKNTKIHDLVFTLYAAGFKIGLLTNMYPGMLEGIRRNQLVPQIQWDIILDSSIEGIKKPDGEIYLLAEKLSGYAPQEILFIDNLEENLRFPKERGWHTLLYDPSNIVLSNTVINEYIFS